MLLICKRGFVTNESGIPYTFMEGTVWYKATYEIAPGGYEDIVLEKMDGGAFTGVIAKVRAEKVNDRTLFDVVPLTQCPEPVGCSTFDTEERS